MRVKFWGTRGSIAVPGKKSIQYGGNTTCVEVTLESNKKIIIDAGTGIRELGEHLSEKESPVDIHLLITHIHWDHISGFPFFAPIHKPNTKISVDGFHACMKGLMSPFDNKMSGGLFPIKFEDLNSRIKYADQLRKGPMKMGGAVIDTIPLQHPQGGLGFRFREGEKTFVFLTDNEISDRATNGVSPVDYVAFCRHADVAVLDAQYTPEEMHERRGWGHSDYMAAIQLAAEARVKQLFLFHHDPSRKDTEITSIVEYCRDFVRRHHLDIIVDAAMEGAELSC